MPATFISGPSWQGSSGPYVPVRVPLASLWPQGTNSGSGTKDTPTNGEHPVFAIGGRTAADGRPLNVTGVMLSYNDDDDIAEMNIADGVIVRQYITNILTYAAGTAATFETAPVAGQPVYVDDSDDLAEGCTLSLSPLNDADVKNPQAGVLWWDQDEYKNIGKGGPNATDQFDGTLADAKTEQLYSVLLFNGSRELA